MLGVSQRGSLFSEVTLENFPLLTTRMKGSCNFCCLMFIWLQPLQQALHKGETQSSFGWITICI